MSYYLDSSALVKLYVKEKDSAGVAHYVQKQSSAIPFSHLHELELTNALRLKSFRQEATGEDIEATLKMIQRDLGAGVLRRPELSRSEVYRQAQELSPAYTSSLGCRSLDLLQLASALVMKVTEFLTFNARQSGLASHLELPLKNLTFAASCST